MKIILLYLSTIFISYNSYAQKSFEGSIKFKIEITTEGENKVEAKKKLDEKYGDSLLVSYSKLGYMKRQYLNSKGYDFQIYYPEKGVLYLKDKRSNTMDSLDVKTNSIVKLISKKKVSNETIIGLDCECYEYVGISKYGGNVTLNYCFSKETTSVDYTVFKNHTDFFIADYFKSSKKPYLKFSLQTDTFKVTQVATEINEKNIDINFFEIK